MMVTCFSGATRLDGSRFLEMLGQWVASCPLARASRDEVTGVYCIPFIHNCQLEDVRHHSSLFFPAPPFIVILMDLTVPNAGF